MVISINKELSIRVPDALYRKAKLICGKESKSMSTLIRELLREKICDDLSKAEVAALQQSRKQYKAGKGVGWRSVKRGKV